MVEDIAKYIIKKLHEVYGYEFFEITGQYGLCSSWGAAARFDGSVKAIVFKNGLDDDISVDISGVVSELSHIFHTGFIDTSVVIISERENYETSFGEEYKKVVIDYKNGNVIYYSPDTIEVAQQIARVLSIDNEKRARSEEAGRPMVTISLIAVNIIYFLISAVLSGGIFDIDSRVLVFLGAKYNSGIASGQYYRLITCMFLHGGILHIALNMYSLYAIGPLVERIYGKVKFLMIYFVSGITASLMSYIMSPGISIGASGAIFGLLGACLVLAVKMKKIIGKSFLSNILSVIAINLVIGFGIPNIDNFAHIGGLLGGIVSSVVAFSGMKQK